MLAHPTAMRWQDVFPSLELAILVRAFYLLAALAILFVRLIPSLRDRFLNYGARQIAPAKISSPDVHQPVAFRLLDFVAQLQVSHSRFGDFYSLSLVCLAFWASQAYFGGAVLRSLSGKSPESNYVSTPLRVDLSFLLLMVQSSRRLYECLVLSKSSKSSSSMWIGHYLIGLAFYFFVSIAVCIDHPHSTDRVPRPTLPASAREGLSSPIDLLAVIAFIVASIKQHKYHKYLASLRKYTLPGEHAFRSIIAPHYTMECLIYLSISVISASQGFLVNHTVLCALFFVIVNLGVTAEGTKRWMLGKFPDQRKDIEPRWRMIPMMF